MKLKKIRNKINKNIIENKSQIWVSVVIYTLVALLALILVLNTGLPLMTELKEKSTFNKIKDNMIELDKNINELSKQGEGSQISVSFDVKEGNIYFKNGGIVWEYETTSNIMLPRTSIKIGNLLIASNSNVQTIEYQDSYVFRTTIKNDTFEVKFKKINSPENPGFINTSQIIEYISFNDNKITGFDFFINKNESSSVGIGYIDFIPKGNNTNLGKAKAIAYVNSSFGKYKLEFTLDSYADFLIVNFKDFQPN
ncbi:MAG: hypothetical protein QXE31_03945 [Candidatus Woesearchaeota archaeon]